MKKIEVERTIALKETKYIASDGTEFIDEYACREHEHKLMISEVLSTVEHALKGWSPFDGEEHMDSHSTIWFKPKSDAEVRMINEAYSLFIGDNHIEECVGEWICVESTEYYESTWVSTLRDSVRYARNLLEKLGYSKSEIVEMFTLDDEKSE